MSKALNYISSVIFRLYDIRGRYPKEINDRAVFQIAGRLPKLLGGKIVVGHDVRTSSPVLYQAVLAGLKNHRRPPEIISVGLVTTPMLYFLVNYFQASGGIMITASHNPRQYNGLKAVGKDAVPISGKEIWKIMNYE